MQRLARHIFQLLSASHKLSHTPATSTTLLLHSSMTIGGGGYRRDHLRVLALRVQVAEREVRIMGSKSSLLKSLTGISLAKTSVISVPSHRA